MRANRTWQNWILVLGYLALGHTLYGGDTTAVRTKGLELSVAVGAAYYPGASGIPTHLDTRSTRSGPALSGRLMWKPGHLLRVGLESGWTTLYSYRFDVAGTEGAVGVTAIPLLLQWSMSITPRWEIYAGWGTYRLTSTLEHLGRVRSSRYSQGYVAAVSYGIPLGERWTGTAEVKWMNAFVTRHHLLALQWRLDWRIRTW